MINDSRFDFVMWDRFEYIDLRPEFKAKRRPVTRCGERAQYAVSSPDLTLPWGPPNGDRVAERGSVQQDVEVTKFAGQFDLATDDPAADTTRK